MAVMPQIETVVMLMLENRSLDSVLGWLHEGKTLEAAQVYPPGSSLRFNGIQTGMANCYENVDYQPPDGTQGQPDPWRVPRWNPHEIWEHVTVQLGPDHCDHRPDSTARPAKPPKPLGPPMAGFVRDYSDRNAGEPSALAEVMGGYRREQLPVLYGLAENFAISDRWFSSVPSETNPNRAFSVCGTSLGAVDNADTEFYDAKTIFNALTGNKTWGVYWQYHGIGDMDPILPYFNCYTEDIFPQLHHAVRCGDGEVGRYDHFLEALGNGGAIPEFCYLEPFWGGGIGYPDGQDFVGLQGNDYHAPAWIGPAEHDLNELYKALRSSPQWKNMLFIITFDEHGGTWDHEPPTPTIEPDDNTGRFDFKTLGVRVPTILVSPFIRPGTVFRAPADSPYDLDHTSFVATILKWAGIDPATAGMGDRVAHAPTFEAVLSDDSFDDSPSHFEVPAGYAEQGGGKGIHVGWPFDATGLTIHAVRAAEHAASSVEDFVHRLEEHVRNAVSGQPPGGH